MKKQIGYISINNRVEFADLVQSGNIGLLEAFNAFDPARNVKFITYATWHIKKRIREAALESSVIRVSASTVSAAKDKHIGEVFYNEESILDFLMSSYKIPIENQEQAVQKRLYLALIERKLNKKERQVIKLRLRSYTLEEVGCLLFFTRERIRQIEADAIIKLKKALKREYYDEH